MLAECCCATKLFGHLPAMGSDRGGGSHHTCERRSLALALALTAALRPCRVTASVSLRHCVSAGMNEVAIGMTVPILGVELARHRMPKAYLSRAVTQAAIFGPDEAVQAGFLDVCVYGDAFDATCQSCGVYISRSQAASSPRAHAHRPRAVSIQLAWRR